jgi:hypothetical protein
VDLVVIIVTLEEIINDINKYAVSGKEWGSGSYLGVYGLDVVC